MVTWLTTWQRDTDISLLISISIITTLLSNLVSAGVESRVCLLSKPLENICMERSQSSRQVNMLTCCPAMALI